MSEEKLPFDQDDLVSLSPRGAEIVANDLNVPVREIERVRLWSVDGVDEEGETVNLCNIDPQPGTYCVWVPGKEVTLAVSRKEIDPTTDDEAFFQGEVDLMNKRRLRNGRSPEG